MRQLNLPVEFPEATVRSRFIEKMENEGKRVYCFGYTPDVENNLITRIFEIAEKIETNGTIVLLGYCLLTQLNVGILYLLAHAFETLEMSVTKDLGLIVTLKNAKNLETRTRIIEIFKEISTISENARNKDKLVISIFPIIKLCGKNAKFSVEMAKEINNFLIFINYF